MRIIITNDFVHDYKIKESMNYNVYDINSLTLDYITGSQILDCKEDYLNLNSRGRVLDFYYCADRMKEFNAHNKVCSCFYIRDGIMAYTFIGGRYFILDFGTKDIIDKKGKALGGAEIVLPMHDSTVKIIRSRFTDDWEKIAVKDDDFCKKLRRSIITGIGCEEMDRLIRVVTTVNAVI